MKKITLVSLFLLLICGIMAQAPERFTYQAVVRNATNQLVASQAVGVRVSVLQGTVTGNPVYVETQTVSTNANGLLTLEIGGGTVQQGSFSDIDWANGPYFLKTETDPNGGSDYTLISTQQLLSVPYALYAKEAGNGFSGDYNDLTNPPTIPTVPTNVSAFTNDAGYLTTYTETDPQFTGWDKDYNDLINKPTIPTVPTDVSVFNNDAGYITAQDIPAIPTIPNNVSAFSNDAGYITMDSIPAIPTVPANVSAFNNDAGYLSVAQCPDADICALLNQMEALQQHVDALQSQVDSLKSIVDTSNNQIIPPENPTEVTFTADGYNHKPAVHFSDLANSGFTNGNTQTCAANTALYNQLKSSYGGTDDDWWFVDAKVTPAAPGQELRVFINRSIVAGDLKCLIYNPIAGYDDWSQFAEIDSSATTDGHTEITWAKYNYDEENDESEFIAIWTLLAIKIIPNE